MKRILIAGICAAMLCLTGCGGTGAEPEQSSAAEHSGGLTVHAEDDVDSAYTDTLKAYFTAIEQKDYEGYQALMYPPYLQSYYAYLEAQGAKPEETFDKLCKRFDEDGYESWTLTDLDVSYYPEDKVDIDDFFAAFRDAGIISDELIGNCKKEAEEIRDIQFTLYALYKGDEEPVAVVSGNEIMMVKTPDGTYLFG